MSKDVDPSFFKDMANKVADIVIEKGLGKDLILLQQHKKVKRAEQDGRVSLSCHVCNMLFDPLEPGMKPCTTKDCIEVWCGRTNLCDLTFPCKGCKRFTCAGCVDNFACNECGASKCGICLQVCSECENIYCAEHFIQDRLCCKCFDQNVRQMADDWRLSKKRTFYANN